MQIEKSMKLSQDFKSASCILQMSKIYQLRISNLTEVALGCDILLLVPNVCGICSCGQDQLSENNRLENGFRFG